MDGYYWDSGRQNGQGARRGPPREQEGEEEQHFDDLMSREPILLYVQKDLALIAMLCMRFHTGVRFCEKMTGSVAV